MAAVVAPVGIQKPNLRVSRVAVFFIPEILLDKDQVLQRHGQSHLLAKILQAVKVPADEILIDRHILHIGVLRQFQQVHVLLAGLHLVDTIFFDLLILAL